MKDNIFSDKQVDLSGFLDKKKQLKTFAFNSAVASVFDDMVSRSVPGYELVQKLSIDIASKIIPLTECSSKNNIYDIGCSTGTSLIRLVSALKSSGLENLPNILGIDSSLPMLDKANQKLRALGLENEITFINKKAEEVNFKNSPLIFCHYTLQFLELGIRLNVLKNIYNGLSDGGVLIISEKVKLTDPLLHDLYTDKYNKFKSSNGYSEAEISRKRAALENVLTPLSVDENLKLLHSAGFKTVDILYSNLLFFSFLARK